MAVIAVMAEIGYSMAMWPIDSNGTTGHDSSLNKTMGSARNGSVVLLHFRRSDSERF